MKKIDLGRRLAGLAVLAVAALALGAVEPRGPDDLAAPPAPAPAADPPAGHLLIASARMQDPRFHQTVILILRHDATGAFGIVVNRPIGDKPVRTLLEIAGDSDGDAEGTIAVMAGGPVEPQRGFVVHSAEYRRAETIAADGKVAMTATREVLRDIGHGSGPKQCFFAFGYAGWGPGQLEGEMARRDWFAVPEEPDLVFDADRGTVWKRALDRRGQEL